MSNFYCPTCQKAIIDSPWKGYITHCIHFPKKEVKVEIPQVMKDIFNL